MPFASWLLLYLYLEATRFALYTLVVGQKQRERESESESQSMGKPKINYFCACRERASVGLKFKHKFMAQKSKCIQNFEQK